MNRDRYPPPDKRPAYYNSPIYQKLTKTGLSSLAASDVYSAIQSLTALDTPDQREYARFLMLVLDLLAIDSAGRSTVVEQNSSSINSNSAGMYSTVRNEPAVSRLRQLGFSEFSTRYDLYRVEIEVTLAAGGTLAATQILSAQADIGYYVESAHISMDPATANIAAAGGNAAVIHLQDDAGSPVILGHMVVTNTHQVDDLKWGGVTGDNQDLDILVEAGTAGNVGASILHGAVHYREI